MDASARKDGMIPLKEDGLAKAVQGIATVEEVLLTVL
jgi:type II secretory ATPase GspE/PulE/Tfp pilus assembly ATPase PilB-like protein